jgi:hypothetical protein
MTGWCAAPPRSAASLAESKETARRAIADLVSVVIQLLGELRLRQDVARLVMLVQRLARMRALE